MLRAETPRKEETEPTETVTSGMGISPTQELQFFGAGTPVPVQSMINLGS